MNDDGNIIIFHRVGNTERQTTRVLARLELQGGPGRYVASSCLLASSWGFCGLV